MKSILIAFYLLVWRSNALEMRDYDLDEFLFDLTDLLQLRNPVQEKCTIIPLSASRFDVVDSSLPVVYSTSPPRLPNYCYIVIFASDFRDKSQMQTALNDLTQSVKAVPKLVLTLGTNRTSGSMSDIRCPWIHLAERTFVTVTCPGCGTSKTGLWLKNIKQPQGNGKFSLNLAHPVCCHPLLGKEVRITYINPYTPYFQLIDNKLDLNTLEGQYLQLLIDKLHLKPKFLDAHFSWGSINKDTGLWNGIVGNLGYDRADIGVTFLSITGQRAAFIDYTMPVTPDNFCWITKTPGPMSPVMNLLQAFDPYSWLAFGAVTLTVVIVLFVFIKVGASYGIPQPSTSLICIVPLRMLNAEALPGWFDYAQRQVVSSADHHRRIKKSPVFSPGFSGNFVLLNWALMGMVLVFAFTCNLRSLMLKVDLAPPIDDSQDLVKSGVKLHLLSSAWYHNYLSTSSNQWHIKAAETAEFYQGAEAEKQMVMKIATEGNTAILRSNFPIISKFINDPDFANIPPVYFSKETVRPYYGAWGVQKMSPWKETVNRHLLIMDQAGLRNKLQSEILHELAKKQTEEELAPLTPEHIFGPSLLLIFGTTIGIFVFIGEILCAGRNNEK